MSNTTYDSIDIYSVTSSDIDLNTVTKDNLFKTYSPYNFYVEQRDASDVPEDYQFNLYDSFKVGLNTLANSGKIIIGEEISSEKQFLLTRNTETIQETFKDPGDVIDYDGMIDLMPSLSPDKTYTELSAVLWDWVNREVYDFSVKQNPEDTDDSNLILTQGLKEKILPVTECILTKILRNFLQLIRVKHDYRLYGVGSTIFSGKAFKNTTQLKNWSSLPASCWQEYTGKYVVGDEAYTEPIDKVNDSIKNATYSISPYQVYGIAAHIHDIEMSTFSMKSDIELNIEPHVITAATFKMADNYTGSKAHLSNTSGWMDYDELVAHHLGGNAEHGAFLSNDLTVESVTYNAVCKYKYSWSSDNAYLVTPADGVQNIFSKDNIVLPTYSSYVWKWVGSDDTSLENI